MREKEIIAPPPKMSDKEFQKFSALIQKECGIKMPPIKQTMLTSRLTKRLRTLGMRSFDQYYEYVCGPEGRAAEFLHMIDAVTTNKTDFFREPSHFDYLTETVLPERLHARRACPSRMFHIWSAGCSTGKEPYTLAMVLSEFAARWQGFRFAILATDISTKVLEQAALGIYGEENAEQIPVPLRKKYLLRSKDRQKQLIRVVPELRKKVTFRRVNFLEEDFGIQERVDVIFFRNVLIYFDRETQEMVLNRLCRYLEKGGYLFTGHSETLNGMDLPLKPVVSTVYRKYRD